MASVTRRLVLSTARASPRLIAPSPAQQWQRPLSSTARRCDGGNGSKRPKDDTIPKPKMVSKPGEPVFSTVDIADSTKGSPVSNAKAENSTAQDAGAVNGPMSNADMKSRSLPVKRPKPTPAEIEREQLKALESQLKYLNEDLIEEEYRTGKRGMKYAEGMEMEDDDFEIPKRVGKPGFWAEGEPSMGPDEDFYGDDITSHGHGQLQEHRELREYARLIAWELPLLNQLAQPFVPPTADTPFRFRYTSYLGESHPAANKVVVQFSPSDLKLSPVQRNKLIKLAGPRYNPSTDVIKMSCELYDTLPQNKRNLGETIKSLIAEAKDPKDTFEDVPFDFRHHKEKVRHEWPQAWSLTPERKKYLEEKRAKSKLLEQEREMNGLLVDGKKIIDNSLPFVAPVAEPVMVAGPRGKALR